MSGRAWGFSPLAIRETGLVVVAVALLAAGALKAADEEPAVAPTLQVESSVSIVEPEGKRLSLYTATQAALHVEEGKAKSKLVALRLDQTSLVIGEGKKATSVRIPRAEPQVSVTSLGAITAVKGIADKELAESLRAFVAGMAKPPSLKVGATWDNTVVLSLPDAPPVTLRMKSTVTSRFKIGTTDCARVEIAMAAKAEHRDSQITAVRIDGEGLSIVTTEQRNTVMAAVKLKTHVVDSEGRQLTVNTSTKASTTEQPFQDWLVKNWWAASTARDHLAALGAPLQQAGIGLGLICSLMVPCLGIAGHLATERSRSRRRKYHALIVWLCVLGCAALGVAVPGAWAKDLSQVDRAFLQQAMTLASRATAFGFAVAMETGVSGAQTPVWKNSARKATAALASRFQVAESWTPDLWPTSPAGATKVADAAKAPVSREKMRAERTRTTWYWVAGIVGAAAIIGGTAYSLSGDDGGGSSTPAPETVAVKVGAPAVTIQVWHPGTPDGDRIDLIVNGETVLTNHDLQVYPGTSTAKTLASGTNTVTILAKTVGNTAPNRVSIDILTITDGTLPTEFQLSVNQSAIITVTAP